MNSHKICRPAFCGHPKWYTAMKGNFADPQDVIRLADWIVWWYFSGGKDYVVRFDARLGFWEFEMREDGFYLGSILYREFITHLRGLGFPVKDESINLN